MTERKLPQFNEYNQHKMRVLVDILGKNFSNIYATLSALSVTQNYRAETVAFTFATADHHVEQQTSATTDTLPNTSSVVAAKVYIYSNVSGGNTTLQTSDSQNIYTPSGSVTSVTVYDGEVYTVQARPGGGWKLI